MLIPEDSLLAGLDQLDLALTENQVNGLRRYLALLQKWNRAYNLTAIREPDKMVRYHLLDSLVLTRCLTGCGQRIADVGTGAGLPGIPLSLVRPGKDFTLLDSNGKKTRFLMQAKIELGLANCQVVNERVENFRPDQAFDCVISRAFASIRDFVTGTEHLLNEGGQFFAMKGKFPDRELAELPERFKIDATLELEVPLLPEQRHLIVIVRA